MAPVAARHPPPRPPATRRGAHACQHFLPSHSARWCFTRALVRGACKRGRAHKTPFCATETAVVAFDNLKATPADKLRGPARHYRLPKLDRAWSLDWSGTLQPLLPADDLLCNMGTRTLPRLRAVLLQHLDLLISDTIGP